MLSRALPCLLLLTLLLLPAAEAQRVRSSIGSSAMNRSTAKPLKRRMTTERLREAAIKAGPLRPTFDQSHRRNFPDPKTRPQRPRPRRFYWNEESSFGQDRQSFQAKYPSLLSSLYPHPFVVRKPHCNRFLRRADFLRRRLL